MPLTFSVAIRIKTDLRFFQPNGRVPERPAWRR
jgi:hypothetical protein